MPKRLSVVNVSGSNHEVEQFSFLVTDKMQLEAEEPAHRALASLCNAPVWSGIDADEFLHAIREGVYVER